jgi:hypothetical protein
MKTKYEYLTTLMKLYRKVYRTDADTSESLRGQLKSLWPYLAPEEQAELREVERAYKVIKHFETEIGASNGRV